MIGYWGAPGTPPSDQAPVPVKPINVPSADSPEIFAQKYPQGFFQNYKVASIFQNDANNNNSSKTGSQSSSTAIFLAVVVGAILGVIGTMFVMKRSAGHQYSPIP